MLRRITSLLTLTFEVAGEHYQSSLLTLCYMSDQVTICCQGNCTHACQADTIQKHLAQFKYYGKSSCIPELSVSSNQSTHAVKTGLHVPKISLCTFHSLDCTLTVRSVHRSRL